MSYWNHRVLQKEDNAYNQLGCHPMLAHHPDLKALYTQAEEALHALYQAAGKKIL